MKKGVRKMKQEPDRENERMRWKACNRQTKRRKPKDSIVIGGSDGC